MTDPEYEDYKKMIKDRLSMMDDDENNDYGKIIKDTRIMLLLFIIIDILLCYTYQRTSPVVCIAFLQLIYLITCTKNEDD